MHQALAVLCGLFLNLVLGSLPALADDTTDYAGEYIKKIDAAKALAPLSSALFGDHINDYTGQLTFSVVDVDLPGNNQLPVQFARIYDVQGALLASDLRRTNGPVGDWDLDIPHLHGDFPAATGWETQTPGVLCAQPTKSLAAPPSVPGAMGSTEPPMDSDVYWKGNNLYVPGQGDDEMLHLDDAAGNKPTDGLAYHWSTRGRWYFSCLPSLDDSATGDGFLGVAPDGTRYYFNHLASRRARDVYGLQRVESWIMPTRVQDRFGNYVTYAYNSTYPWMLLSITASDGRQITINYPTGGHTNLASVTDGSRVWAYNISADGLLQSVTLPDGSQWTYGRELIGIQSQIQPGFGTGTGVAKGAWTTSTGVCGYYPWIIQPASNHGVDLLYTIQSPSGAQGAFTLNFRNEARTYVPQLCGGYTTSTEVKTFDRYAPVFAALGMTSKVITGPGVSETWSWSYPTVPTSSNGGVTLASTYDFQCTAGCPTTKQMSVIAPDGSVIRRTFGIQYGVNDGQLLKTDYLDKDGATVLRTETENYLTNPSGQAYPASVGDPFKLFNNPLDGVLVPEWQKQTTQQGVTFTRLVTMNPSGVYSFDAFAKPTEETSSSTMGFSRTTDSTYYSDLNKWVLDLPASSMDTSTALVMSQTQYDPATSLPAKKYRFGELIASMTYNTDGTLATIADGDQQTTTLSSWKRGLPQSIKFADKTSKSAVVNNQGWITGITDENGFATGYAYDPMGRLATILPPAGDVQADGTPITWAPTSTVYTQATVAEYGLPAGHWTETETTGNANKVTYYDALWRPVLTKEFDAAIQAGTTRASTHAFDHEGRTTFSSYPVAGVTNFNDSISGVHTTFDGLGRTSTSIQDSELGPLTTSYAYLQGFSTQITNPRKSTTTLTYQAFDSPDTGHPTAISSPLGVATTINRDVFGKPLTITRSGTWGGNPISETRSYVYDAYQRLCKRLEPETGATPMNYDGADNLLWGAPGSTLPSTTSCDNGVIPANAIVNTYDLRNRPQTRTVPNSTGIAWKYYPDGALQNLTSGSGSTANVWSYQYNKLRLPLTENLTIDGRSETFTHVYDVLGHEASLTYPSGLVVAAAPNALGQPTQAGTYATGVNYFPNGGMSGFTYGNGIVHSLTENARELPLRSLDQLPGAPSTLDDTYTYDADANVTGIADGTSGGPNSRTMGYDALDRLTGTSAPGEPWITSSTQYDGLDNIRSNTVGSRFYNYVYDTSWRLSKLNDGNTHANVMTLGYDANGNVTSKGTGYDSYGFDAANRLQSVTGKESYAYDGYGRRVKVTSSSGKLDYPVYDRTGRLLTEDDQRINETINYVSLNGSLVAKVSAPIGGTTWTKTYEHTDALRSPTYETNAAGTLTSSERYTPYGEPSNGSYVQGPGFTGHVTDATTGLIYAQQRFYDPVLGRFLSPDPKAVDTKTASNFCRYCYAANNPYRNVDLDGRESGSYYTNPELRMAPPNLDYQESGYALQAMAIIYTGPLADAVVGAIATRAELAIAAQSAARIQSVIKEANGLAKLPQAINAAKLSQGEAVSAITKIVLGQQKAMAVAEGANGAKVALGIGQLSTTSGTATVRAIEVAANGTTTSGIATVEVSSNGSSLAFKLLKFQSKE